MQRTSKKWHLEFFSDAYGEYHPWNLLKLDLTAGQVIRVGSSNCPQSTTKRRRERLERGVEEDDKN